MEKDLDENLWINILKILQEIKKLCSEENGNIKIQ